MDRYVTVSQGSVFFITETLASLEGLEKGPAGNTALAAAFRLAQEMDEDQCIVVQETEYTGAGKHINPQLSFARQNGIDIHFGDPKDEVPGKNIILPAHPSLIRVDDVDLDRIPKKSEEAFLNARPDATPAQWELGKTAYRNQSKYGAPTWYEWSIQNWGTKWNAYNSVECEPHGDTAELCFHTAWSPPQPVLQRLSEQYPELAFSHAWADEDIGFNCGIIEYKNGEIISEYLPEGNEAVSFACEQWGYNPEEYEDMTMNM